jgi:putative transposase
MSHSLHKIWIHAIWGTKFRAPLIQSNVEARIHQHIHDQLSGMGCHVFAINGMLDHVHCLFLLNAQKTIAEVMKQVKGSTAHWVNSNNITPQKLAWQTGYAAYSVSESGMKNVQRYINNQKKHHAKKTFAEEYDEFMKAYNVDPN